MTLSRLSPCSDQPKFPGLVVQHLCDLRDKMPSGLFRHDELDDRNGVASFFVQPKRKRGAAKILPADVNAGKSVKPKFGNIERLRSKFFLHCHTFLASLQKGILARSDSWVPSKYNFVACHKSRNFSRPSIWGQSA